MQGLAFVFALGPINLPCSQRFADAVGDRETAGSGRDHGKLRDHGADFGIRAHLAAQSHTEYLGRLVIAHRERYLKVFGYVLASRILEMAVTQPARLAQKRNYIFLRRDKFHRI
jgi:hypothetical protein